MEGETLKIPENPHQKLSKQRLLRGYLLFSKVKPMQEKLADDVNRQQIKTGILTAEGEDEEEER